MTQTLAPVIPFPAQDAPDESEILIARLMRAQGATAADLRARPALRRYAAAMDALDSA